MLCSIFLGRFYGMYHTILEHFEDTLDDWTVKPEKISSLGTDGQVF